MELDVISEEEKNLNDGTDEANDSDEMKDLMEVMYG